MKAPSIPPDWIRKILAWGKSKPKMIGGLILYGSRVYGDPKPASDLDVSVEFIPDPRISDFFGHWLAVAQEWDDEVNDLGIPVQVHLQWIGDEEIAFEVRERGIRVL